MVEVNKLYWTQENGGHLWNTMMQPLFQSHWFKKNPMHCAFYPITWVSCFNIKIFPILSVSWFNRKMLLVELWDFGIHACSSWKSVACIQNSMFLKRGCSSQGFGEGRLSLASVALLPTSKGWQQSEMPVLWIEFWPQHLLLLPLWSAENLQGSEKNAWCPILVAFGEALPLP